MNDDFMTGSAIDCRMKRISNSPLQTADDNTNIYFFIYVFVCKVFNIFIFFYKPCT